MTKSTRETSPSVLLTVAYALMYLGANDGLWPLIAHFHHHDSQIPAIADSAISSVVLPLVVAYMLAALRRSDKSGYFPVALLLIPMTLLLLGKYLADALYPPWWSQASSILLAGAVQGISALAGWFLYGYLKGKEVEV